MELPVKAQDYGLTQEKEQELLSNLPQIKSEREVLEKQYEEVILLDIDDKKTVKKARELRLRIKDNRTKGIMVWHKSAKEFFLRGGQFVDAIKNKEIQVNERMESKLEEIEKYAENKEKERLAALQQERQIMLSPYVENAEQMKLAEMDEEVFNAFYESKKKAHEERLRIEAEEREKARIKQEKQDKFNQRKFELAKYDGITTLELSIETTDEEFSSEISSCESIKKEREEEAKRLREEQERISAQRKERAEIIKPFIMFVTDYEGMMMCEPESFAKSLEEAKQAKDAHDAEQQRIAEEKAKAEEILRKEREEKERLEKELQAKKEEEERQRIAAEKQAEAERKAKLAAEKKAMRAPDKKKLETFLSSFLVQFPEMKTEEGKQAVEELESMISDFKTRCQELIEQL